jgi:hypothetical protein
MVNAPVTASMLPQTLISTHNFLFVGSAFIAHIYCKYRNSEPVTGTSDMCHRCTKKVDGCRHKKCNTAVLLLLLRV